MSKRRDFIGLEKRRMRAIGLLESGHSQSEIAGRLEVSRQSVHRWAKSWRQNGADALRRAGRAGRKPRLEPDQVERLRQILLSGPQAAGLSTPLWTLARVAAVIRKEFGVHYHVATVFRLLSKQLGWSCQRPTGQARERNEEAITRWKEVDWPRIKKKPAPRVGPSSSSMKAA